MTNCVAQWCSIKVIIKFSHILIIPIKKVGQE